MCLVGSCYQLIRIVGIILYVHVCAVGPHRAVNTSTDPAALRRCGEKEVERTWLSFSHRFSHFPFGSLFRSSFPSSSIRSHLLSQSASPVPVPPLPAGGMKSCTTGVVQNPPHSLCPPCARLSVTSIWLHHCASAPPRTPDSV